jgi:hypothetical protein
MKGRRRLERLRDSDEQAWKEDSLPAEVRIVERDKLESVLEWRERLSKALIREWGRRMGGGEKDGGHGKVETGWCRGQDVGGRRRCGRGGRGTHALLREQ